MATGTRSTPNIRVYGDFQAYWAPIGTTAPAALTGTVATDVLPAAWLNLGWQDDGVGFVATRSPSTTPVTVYGTRQPVRTTVTNETETLQFAPVETKNVNVLDMWAGNAPGTTTAPTGSNPITITTGATQYPAAAFVFDLFDGGNQMRVYVPSGQVTSVGAETFKEGVGVTHEVTITANFSTTAQASVRREYV